MMAQVIKYVRVGAKGRVVIPIEIRRRIGIRPGDLLMMVGHDDQARMLTVRQCMKNLRGIVKGVYGRTQKEIDAYVSRERRGMAE